MTESSLVFTEITSPGKSCNHFYLKALVVPIYIMPGCSRIGRLLLQKEDRFTIMNS
jgi:hypothetical protein